MVQCSRESLPSGSGRVASAERPTTRGVSLGIGTSRRMPPDSTTSLATPNPSPGTGDRLPQPPRRRPARDPTNFNPPGTPVNAKTPGAHRTWGRLLVGHVKWAGRSDAYRPWAGGPLPDSPRRCYRSVTGGGMALKWFTASLAVLATASCAAPSSPPPAPAPAPTQAASPAPDDPRAEVLRRRLKLSDEQAGKLRELYRADAEAEQRLQEERRARIRALLDDAQRKE